MPIIQRTTFPVSDAFSSDVLKTTVDIAKRTTGYISSFHGLQVEDSNIGYFIGVWTSSEAYTSFVQGKDYSEFVASIKGVTSSELQIHYVDVAVNPETALLAPVTELVHFTMKAGVPVEDTYDLFAELASGLDQAAGGHPPAYWGRTGNSNEVQVYVGWDTVETHWDAVKEGTHLHSVIQKLLERSDFVLGHTRLTKSAA
ncbi:hypothetical protein C8F04DRAFT_1122406 [Mycena alexandri]|uniref:ABM domain-containing protein n=1 Tax=Mycena alexandri TaxID=1745969 RepID=A0AAD6SHS6_9AGAR|nr:hypothetical protein C8F04DRAFT_1122406 [Mycena alexandri]